jgi:beta-phosphoglucomutase
MCNMARLIRGVIFDLDGVLVSTDELHYQAWKQIADDEGIPFDRQVNERLRGVSRMESLAIILERSGRPLTVEERQDFADRKNALYRQSLETLTEDDVLPGARALLGDLRRRGLKLAIASSSRNAPLILERIGLAADFDAMADGNDITRSKPDPQVFLLAAERLNLPPEQCLVVEDALAGIDAARAAGMAVFYIGDPPALPGAGACACDLSLVTADELLAAADA